MVTTLPLMVATIFSSELFEQSDDVQSTSSEESSPDSIDEDETPPTTVINIVIHNKKTDRNETMTVLLDSGSNQCIGTATAAKRAGLKIYPSKRVHSYKTAAGKFMTTQRTRIRTHRILELNSKRLLKNQDVKITDSDLGKYNFIFGRNYMHRYGIDLLFSTESIQWDGMRMKMKSLEDLNEEQPGRRRRWNLLVGSPTRMSLCPTD